MDALTPIEQKQVVFYEDEITAVRTEDGTVYVALPPLCNALGIDWSAQRRRILRDVVLSESAKSIMVDTPARGQQETTCLPLDYLSGFLFGIAPNRVRAELRDRIIRYQRECYRVLAEAFQSGRLTSEIVSDSPAAIAYQMATAVAELARSQMQLETAVADHNQRLELIEAQLGNSGRYITQDQASQISQAVKAVAMVLSKKLQSNQYGSVYGEMYRRFSITSYKMLPAARFEDCMQWLTDWHFDLTGESPF